MGMTERVDAHDPVVSQADEETHKLLQETMILAQATHVNLHVTDWVTTQQEDPILKTTIEWISGQKVQDLKHLLGDDKNTEEGKTILQEQKKLMLYQGALYYHYTPRQIGRSFAIHSPQGSLSSHHEWMPQRCWTPRPAADTVLTTRPVLVARNVCTDAEGD